MREHVGKLIGKFVAPANIVFSPEVPSTRSGKSCDVCCATSQKIDRWVTPPRGPILR